VNGGVRAPIERISMGRRQKSRAAPQHPFAERRLRPDRARARGRLRSERFADGGRVSCARLAALERCEGLGVSSTRSSGCSTGEPARQAARQANRSSSKSAALALAAACEKLSGEAAHLRFEGRHRHVLNRVVIRVLDERWIRSPLTPKAPDPAISVLASAFL